MEFTLSITAERSVVRESLKGMYATPAFELLLTAGLLWTIFFHRLFGPVTPTTNEFIDIPYPMAVGLPDLDSLIDQKIDQLIKKDFGPPHAAAAPSVGQLVVAFLDKNKLKKKSGWFGHSKDDAKDLVRWELWIINVNCFPVALAKPDKANTSERLLQLSLASFEDNLLEIMTHVDKNKAHIPPILTLDVSPFPYEIEIDPVGAPPPAADDESWRHYVERIMD